ncbi:hypothetical protein ACOQFV_30570 [Nocardiopsis changdeensis]|uniref:Uncharacterized protein n=1 Tax=Nocardiopsis changdeensis TaxID=2831969 RepID=A0ABX8BR15_9ACTN|nr:MULTISPECIES: hypothetical protein [Nocardiopsis]QUX24175.1 hypothetical protein KGD84_07695 [Nocardiopsis changdeensis]QYX34569.1 hypothetical protein K1J57_17155 [Nocardiopsis sp. MT53]
MEVILELRQREADRDQAGVGERLDTGFETKPTEDPVSAAALGQNTRESFHRPELAIRSASVVQQTPERS